MHNICAVCTCRLLGTCLSVFADSVCVYHREKPLRAVVFFYYFHWCTATILQLLSPKKTAVTNKTSAHVFGRPRRSDSTPTTLCRCAPLQLAFKSTSRTNGFVSPPHVAPESFRPNRHINEQAVAGKELLRCIFLSCCGWSVACWKSRTLQKTTSVVVVLKDVRKSLQEEYRFYKCWQSNYPIGIQQLGSPARLVQ